MRQQAIQAMTEIAQSGTTRSGSTRTLLRDEYITPFKANGYKLTDKGTALLLMHQLSTDARSAFVRVIEHDGLPVCLVDATIADELCQRGVAYVQDGCLYVTLPHLVPHIKAQFPTVFSKDEVPHA